jgi:hypothetical protein
MVIIKTIKRNLLNAKENYIAHQCNCITTKSKGLAKSISDKFNHGDYYGQRTPLTPNTAIVADRDKPGTIKILYGKPNIICIFSQWTPGKVASIWADRYPKLNGKKETTEDRLQWFADGIKLIEQTVKEPIAIPYKIGCGMAGGNWIKYKKILEDSTAKFIIYKID